MNTEKTNTDPKKREDLTEDYPESPHTPSNHRYNLKPNLPKDGKYTRL